MNDEKTTQNILRLYKKFLKSRNQKFKSLVYNETNSISEADAGMDFVFLTLELISCANNDKLSCIEAAQKKGLDLSIVDDEQNNLFFFISMSNIHYHNTEGILNYIKFLKQQNVDINHLNTRKENCLFYSGSSPYSVAKLLENGANPFIENNKNQTVLMFWKKKLRKENILDENKKNIKQSIALVSDYIKKQQEYDILSNNSKESTQKDKNRTPL